MQTCRKVTLYIEVRDYEMLKFEDLVLPLGASTDNLVSINCGILK